MIIEKDQKTMLVNAHVWNEDVRIYSDAKEIIRPDGVFVCRGMIMGDEHCRKLMEAVSLCREKGVNVGLILADSNSNRTVIDRCARYSHIEDSVLMAEETETDIQVLDTIDLPSVTMSGYYFINADRLCGETVNEINEIILACVEGAK